MRGGCTHPTLCAHLEANQVRQGRDPQMGAAAPMRIMYNGHHGHDRGGETGPHVMQEICIQKVLDTFTYDTLSRIPRIPS